MSTVMAVVTVLYSAKHLTCRNRATFVCGGGGGGGGGGGVVGVEELSEEKRH